MDEKATRYNALVEAALLREPMDRSMHVLRAGGDGKTTRAKVRCDFRDATALDDVDGHIMLAIKDLLAVARKREMTGIPQRFSPQSLYAIDVLGSVSKMTFQEITWELYPQMRPPPTGHVVAFPGAARLG